MYYLQTKRQIYVKPSIYIDPKQAVVQFIMDVLKGHVRFYSNLVTFELTRIDIKNENVPQALSCVLILKLRAD